MKKNLILSLLLLLPAFMMQSCLHNQEDKFDEVSSRRTRRSMVGMLSSVNSMK